MNKPILKKYDYNSTYHLWLELKRRQISPSFLKKRKKFQNCINQTDKCFAFLQKKQNLITNWCNTRSKIKML